MTQRPGEAYATVLGGERTDARPSNNNYSPTLLGSDLRARDDVVRDLVQGAEGARIREQAKTAYDHELPERGTPQRDLWDRWVAEKMIDFDAVPGTTFNPVFEKAGRAPPPPGAARVDLAGIYHPAEGAYLRVMPEVLPEVDMEAPVTLQGTAKAALSGLAGSVYNLAASVNPQDPHGQANSLEAVTTLGGWIGNKTGLLSDEDYENILDSERKLRRRLGFAGQTTDEVLHSLGLYHDPQNGVERGAEFVGEQLPYMIAPELEEFGASNRLKRMAERAAMREMDLEAKYLAGRQITRVARATSPIIGGEAGDVTARVFGGDETDRAMMRSIGAGLGSLPYESGVRPFRHGGRWNLKAMPPEQIYDVSTQKMTPADVADSIEAIRRNNAYSYLNDGFTVQSTKGKLASDAAAWRRERRSQAEASGSPYRFQVGHSPDTALSGKAYSIMPDMDQRPMSNAVIGGGLSQRIGDHIRVFKLDGVPHGLPSRFDGLAYYGLMGGQLVNGASQDHDR